MIFNSFWKKIFILNIVLLIVVYRIFNVIEKYLKQNSYYNSLFPVITEDGYPFFNSINCDIRSLISITKRIIDNYNTQKFLFPNNLMTSKDCSFISKYTICKENIECLKKINKNKEEINVYNSFDIDNFNYLYHSEVNDYKIQNIIGISSFINILNNKNKFIDSNNNNIEISFYNKIISGYYSFLIVKQYDNNIKKNLHTNNNDYYNYNILRQITQYENKVNDLFYLHSLILYSYIKLNKNSLNENSTEIADLNNILDYAHQCIELSDYQFELTQTKIIPKNSKNFEIIFKKEIKDLIDCIPDIYERSSFLIDIVSLNAMVKVLSEGKNITEYEYNSLHYFLVELSKRINDIFNAEIELKNKVNLLQQNHIYIIIIYGCLSLAGILFINRYFMKNKNKYEAKRKRKEFNDNYKYNNLTQNFTKKQNDNKTNNNENKKQLTQEELEYIQKLAKENKGDFLIAK